MDELTIKQLEKALRIIEYPIEYFISTIEDNRGRKTVGKIKT